MLNSDSGRRKSVPQLGFARFDWHCNKSVDKEKDSVEFRGSSFIRLILAYSNFDQISLLYDFILLISFQGFLQEFGIRLIDGTSTQSNGCSRFSCFRCSRHVISLLHGVSLHNSLFFVHITSSLLNNVSFLFFVYLHFTLSTSVFLFKYYY